MPKIHSSEHLNNLLKFHASFHCVWSLYHKWSEIYYMILTSKTCFCLCICKWWHCRMKCRIKITPRKTIWIFNFFFIIVDQPGRLIFWLWWHLIWHFLFYCSLILLSQRRFRSILFQLLILQSPVFLFRNSHHHIFLLTFVLVVWLSLLLLISSDIRCELEAGDSAHRDTTSRRPRLLGHQNSEIFASDQT